jgi:hypothetical protein
MLSRSGLNPAGSDTMRPEPGFIDILPPIRIADPRILADYGKIKPENQGQPSPPGPLISKFRRR